MSEPGLSSGPGRSASLSAHEPNAESRPHPVSISTGNSRPPSLVSVRSQNGPHLPSNIPENVEEAHDSTVAQEKRAGVSQAEKPLNISNRTSSRPKKPSTSAWLNNLWFWQIFAGAFSFASFASICIVLAIYDGHPEPNIRWGITLNAVIALLTTIMKAALVAELADGISQLKWLAFAGKRRRPLAEFAAYDSASRGGLGSLALMWRFRRRFGREIISLAALFYVLSLAVDTFTQQLIQTRYTVTASGTSGVGSLASIRYDSYYQNADNHDLLVPDDLDPDMTAAVYSGFYGSANTTQQLYSCSSGNCSYPITPSLAMCSQCANLSSQLSEDSKDSLWSLPNGVGIETQSLLMNSVATSNASTTNAFQRKDPLIAAFAVVSGQPYVGVRPTAFECALFLCVQAYDASFTSGSLTQSVTQTWSSVRAHPIAYDVYGEIDNGAVQNYYDFEILTTSDIPPPSRDLTFNMSSKAFLVLQAKMPLFFNGTVTSGTHGLTAEATYSSDLMQRLYTISNLTDWVSRIAESMTDSIRRNPAEFADFLQTSNYTSPQYRGMAYRTVPYIHIIWAWIALPAAVVLFANAFLVYAMVRTHRARKFLKPVVQIGAWKSSLLPVLYHGLDAQSMAVANEQSEGMEEMEDHAERFLVRFQVEEDGNLKLSNR